jgi:Phage terminase, small subunit
MSKPAWLTKPLGLAGRSLTLWHEYASHCWRTGHLRVTNAELFRSMCRNLAAAEAAAAALERDGVTLRSDSGASRLNPAFDAMLRAQDAAEPLLEHFGLGAGDEEI